ncbi:MAG: polyphosphate kinase 2 [Paracoccaceae bacterium]
MALPFDGAISAFYNQDAPQQIRDAIAQSEKGHILAPDYPYSKRLSRKKYDAEFSKLQIELVKLQSWTKETGARIAIVFEGRDAAGKGGTIKRFRENLNPRGARIVALSKPTETQASQWYFQRYIKHLPSAGEIVFFDRSWYNRAVVEHVFGFCSPEERGLFFRQTPRFEDMLAADGIKLVKFWLNVSRPEQLRRFLQREKDTLKQWKLSKIDVEGLKKWDSYSSAIADLFEHTHSPKTPWTVIRTDDKRRARLAAMQHVLSRVDYAGKDHAVVGPPDPLICGGPDIWHG